MKYLFAFLIFGFGCTKVMEFNPPVLSSSVVRNGKYWYVELDITDSIFADTYANVSWTTYDSVGGFYRRVTNIQRLPARNKRNGYYSTVSAEGNIRAIDVKIDTAHTEPYYYQIKY